MILFNMYTTLAIVLASPIVINIFLYNLFLDQRGIVEAICFSCLLTLYDLEKAIKFCKIICKIVAHLD